MRLGTIKKMTKDLGLTQANINKLYEIMRGVGDEKVYNGAGRKRWESALERVVNQREETMRRRASAKPKVTRGKAKSTEELLHQFVSDVDDDDDDFDRLDIDDEDSPNRLVLDDPEDDEEVLLASPGYEEDEVSVDTSTPVDDSLLDFVTKMQQAIEIEAEGILEANPHLSQEDLHGLRSGVLASLVKMAG